MEKKFTINLEYENQFAEFELPDRISNNFITVLYDYTQITLDSKQKLSDILSDEKVYDSLKKELGGFVSDREIFMENDDEIVDYNLKIYDEMCTKTKEEFYSDFKNIEFIGSTDEIVDYLNANPVAKKFNIVLSKNYGLTDEDIITAKEDIRRVKEACGHDNIFITLAGNEDVITYANLLEISEIVNSFIKEIKTLKLSPAETIMYVYDNIRSRVYKEEEKGEASTKSRALASVLLGNYIVCAGYVNYMITVLTKLGINCGGFGLKGEPNGHVQLAAYVDDSKYDIHGLYFFDPTGDSKKENDLNNDYLFKYSFFLKTGNEIRYYNEINDLKEEYPFLDNELIEEYRKSLPKNIHIEDIVTKKLSKKLRPMAKLAGIDISKVPEFNPFETIDKDQLFSLYDTIYNEANKMVPIETFANLLYNVRLLEYYVHPDKFPFNKEGLIKAVATNSPFKYGYLKMFKELFGLSRDEWVQNRLKQATKGIKEEEIEQVKLTRELRNILIKKNS